MSEKIIQLNKGVKRGVERKCSEKCGGYTECSIKAFTEETTFVRGI